MDDKPSHVAFEPLDGSYRVVPRDEVEMKKFDDTAYVIVHCEMESVCHPVSIPVFDKLARYLLQP